MVNSADKRFKYDNGPTVGAGSSVTIAETSTTDSIVRNSKGKTIWEKSPEEVEDEVEALIESRGDSCPERKRRHDKFNKEWDQDEESLDRKHSCTTPSVCPKIESSLQKVSKGVAELKELHIQIEESIEKLIEESRDKTQFSLNSVGKSFFSACGSEFGLIY